MPWDRIERNGKVKYRKINGVTQQVTIPCILYDDTLGESLEFSTVIGKKHVEAMSDLTEAEQIEAIKPFVKEQADAEYARWMEEKNKEETTEEVDIGSGEVITNQ